MDLSGIEEALRKGYSLHGFEDDGDKVIRVVGHGQEIGYGYEPDVVAALTRANEGCITKLNPFMVLLGLLRSSTGVPGSMAHLNQWLHDDNSKFDAYFGRGRFVAELTDRVKVSVPLDLVEQVRRTGQSATWQNRGYTITIQQLALPSGGFYIDTTTFTGSPQYPDSSPWGYKIRKICYAYSLEQAIGNAVNDRTIEVPWRYVPEDIAKK